MTAAEQLKAEMAGSVVFDKDKVIAAVKNGIKRDGVAYITYFGYKDSMTGIVYRYNEVEVTSGEECQAIKQFLQKEGFALVTYHHPASYRPIGYKVMLY